MSRERKDATAGQTAKHRLQRKRRRQPPWGDILGGKPIERQTWMFGEKVEWEEQFLRNEQYSRMLRLKNHYDIVGGDNPYPTMGVAPADWLRGTN